MSTTGDLQERIIQVISHDISPIIKTHGGEIIFKSYANGVVTITLGGNCNGCMSAQITAEQVVKEKLVEKLGDVIKEVVVSQEIDPELWNFAKKFLRGEENGLERGI